MTIIPCKHFLPTGLMSDEGWKHARAQSAIGCGLCHIDSLAADLARVTAERDEAHKLLARRVDADRLSEANEKLTAVEAERDRAREALTEIRSIIQGGKDGTIMDLHRIVGAALAPAQDAAAKGGA